MKHLRRISVAPPAANVFQDFLCIILVAMNNILGAFGGTAPLGSLVEDKCIITPPDDTGSTT